MQCTDGSWLKFHFSVECYDVDTDLWKLVSPLVEHRSGAGAASLNNYVYAIGGYNGETQLNSVERYDQSSDNWTVISPLIHRRSALSATVLCSKLYVVGGYDGEGFLNTLEEYIPDEDRWQLVSSMNLGRSGAGIAVGWKPAFNWIRWRTILLDSATVTIKFQSSNPVEVKSKKLWQLGSDPPSPLEISDPTFLPPNSNIPRPMFNIIFYFQAIVKWVSHTVTW